MTTYHRLFCQIGQIKITIISIGGDSLLRILQENQSFIVLIESNLPLIKLANVWTESIPTWLGIHIELETIQMVVREGATSGSCNMR